ncbi:glycerate kinase [Kibdelosporangium banguiense]|uniref:Glycerate kinase n=1 Tax=Kibdelosporangium banguiense TaxID=1365924 RepID=A0ABS4U3B6_9PSEU|nr:glycerate kinase [Kibdelosporangium banguiense]MBP2331158.1 glycerate kinase [Kibdelosporangium banguiense]
MRVLIAPDCFGGTLTAPEAAQAMADGWHASAPGDELVLRPLTDGGPGFVDVLHTVLGGTLHTMEVTGPLGAPVTATWLEHDGTAYVESAQANGLHLVPKADRRPLDATTRGVGELMVAARDAGVDRIVVGLGGSATTDGGKGMLEVTAGDWPKLIAATDVENPLLGPHGAAHTFGPQKGASPQDVQELERRLEAFSADKNVELRDEPGAGAAGGLGYGLFLLGATRVSGAGLVRDLTGLDKAMADAQLVLTGEGSFDWQSLRGKLVTSVASAAAERGLPCLVLAGQVSVGRREAAAAGIEAAFAVVEHAGSVEAAFADPAGTLAELARSVASQWSA